MKAGFSLKTQAMLGLTSVALLVAAISAAVLIFVWQTRASHRQLAEEVSELVTVADMRSDLVREKLALGVYLMEGGSPDRLQEIESARAAFRAQLAKFEAVVDTSKEREALARLNVAIGRYEAGRSKTVDLYARGHRSEAQDAYRGELEDLYGKTLAVLGETILVDKSEARSALSASGREMRHLLLFVTVGAGLATLLSAGVIWLLLRGVFGPLKRMAEDCRAHLPDGPDAPRLAEVDSQGDLTLLGLYMRALMTEVNRARVDQEKIAATARSRSGWRPSAAWWPAWPTRSRTH